MYDLGVYPDLPRCTIMRHTTFERYLSFKFKTFCTTIKAATAFFCKQNEQIVENLKTAGQPRLFDVSSKNWVGLAAEVEIRRKRALNARDSHSR